MSRSQRRSNVIRGSILQDMAEKGQLTRRQSAAALRLERAREEASGLSTSICKYGTGPGGSGGRPPIARETFAHIEWEGIKRALPPYFRGLLGEIERANVAPGRKGSLSALSIRTGLADSKDDALVKRGIIAGLCEVVADHLRLPEEA